MLLLKTILGLRPNWPPVRRTCALEGMLEYWNNGKMGFGILQCWAIGSVRFDNQIKLTKSFQKPIFHHSAIPLFHYRDIN